MAKKAKPEKPAKLGLNGDEKVASEYEVSDINLRVLAAASAFASKDEDRYYLNGVCLEIEDRSITYIATDGHCLICCRHDKDPQARENRLLGSFIIPTSFCKVHKLDKDDEGDASIFQIHGRLTIAHSMTDVTFVPVDADYPDWRKVVPKKGASGTLAQYSFKMLDGFRKFAEATDMPANPFLAPNGDGPAFIWFHGNPNAFGIVMPYRSVDLLGQKPAEWAVRGGPPREQSDIEDDLLQHPVAEEQESETDVPVMDSAEETRAGVH